MAMVAKKLKSIYYKAYSNSNRCQMGSIEDRIVSLSQPHIRSIVRGKAGKHTEFGAKLSASCCEGYVFLDRISWDHFLVGGECDSTRDR